MDNPETKSSAELRIIEEIQDLGLSDYVAELDERGFTVIPPEIACPNGLDKRLLEEILRVSEERSGIKPDLKNGSTHKNFGATELAEKNKELGLGVESTDGISNDSPIGEFLPSLIFEGQVFEDALMNPVLLAMSTYLLGYQCVLSSMTAFLKGPNKVNLDLHCDTLLPNPLPDHALVCNCTYALTDYNKENGSIAFVPGSHKKNRAPNKSETTLSKDSNAIHVDAKAGSLIIFHGACWHGAYNRTAKGLRVTMPVLMARTYMRTEENLCEIVPDEMLNRNGPRFPILMQQGHFYSVTDYRKQPERKEKMYKFYESYNKSIDGVLDSGPDLIDSYG